MTMSTTARLLLIATMLVPAVGLAQEPDPAERAAETITQEDIARRLGIIAADSMGGRNTPSEGLELAARYIATEFSDLGLEPGGDEGTFIQRYPLRHVELDLERSRVEFEGGPTLEFGDDIAYSLGRLGPETLAGPLTVVYGTVPSAERLAQLGLEESIVLYAVADLDAATRAGVVQLYRQRPSVLFVVSEFDDSVWEYVTSQPPPSRLLVPGQQLTGRAVLLMREGKLASFLSGRGISLPDSATAAGDLEVRRLEEARVTVRFARRERSSHTAPNAVGILSGADPELSDEYIVFSAHMDHIGTAGAPLASCRAQGSDTICNGADDDGSGTVAILELAEAFASLNPRPRRSLIFLAVSGEEKGLLGSRYYTGAPGVEVESMVANLNADMIGRNWNDTVAVIGRQHSDLGQTLDRVAAEHPELRMTPIDDPWPHERFYFRSDHYNFARVGVPILFFFSGTHPDYHRAGDEVAKINFDKTTRIVRLMFYLGLEVANRDARPRWNQDSYREIVETGDGDR